MKMHLSVLAGICAAALPAGTALAHHSHANYEATKVIQISGMVTDYQWVNPHTWVYMTVIGENGEEQEWVLESGSTGQLVRRGWTADSMKPGDRITAHVKPLKDGSYGGILGVIVLEDGTNLCDPFGDIDIPGTNCAP